MNEQHPELIQSAAAVDSPSRSRGRLSSRIGFGSVACVVVVLLVGASIAADGWLFRIERDLGFGLGVGLMPVMALGILVGIGFLILGMAESRDDASKRSEGPRRRISLEDLPPLIGVGRAPIHRH